MEIASAPFLTVKCYGNVTVPVEIQPLASVTVTL